MFQVLNFVGRAVARQHDLLVRLVQRVERVEKLFLNAFLAREKLYVVNQQHVGLAIFFAEADELIVLNGVDVFVGEFFRRNVGDARALFVSHDVLTDGVQQMRLAQSDAAIKKQRVVGFSRRLRDRQGCGVRKAVIVADDKRVEGVFGVETMVTTTGGRFLGFLHRLRFRRSAFAGKRRACRQGSDLELDF